LHDVGCTATVRKITEADDGEFDIVTVGTDRFNLHSVDESKAYLSGEIELLGEPTGDAAAAELVAGAVQRGFRGYLNVLADRGSTTINVPELPDEPILLSYLVAASMIIELNDRQGLLAQPDAVRRLTAERSLLARETAIMRELGTTPATELRATPYSPN